jgi:DNA-binding response OmpR family regulator
MVPRRMLIVEDDDATRRLLSRFFAARGWDVAAAATLAQGHGAMDSGPPPDCLVLDLMLPDGDGADLLRRVRSEGLPSRVVVTTGVGDPGRIMGVASSRPDAVMRKPIDPDAVCRYCEGPTEGA